MLNAHQGDHVKILCQIRDLNGYLTNGIDPKISIYPYGKKPGLPGVTTSNAVVLHADPGAPVRLGQYLYEYEIPNNAMVGSWYAYWEVNIGTEEDPIIFKNIIPFLVMANQSLPGDYAKDSGNPLLLPNNRYVIEIRGLLDTDGNSLEDESWFTSRYDPMYARFDEVLASTGSIIGDIDEDTVNFLIYRYSRYAESYTFNSDPVSRTEGWLNHVRKDYVINAVSIDLIENISLALGAPKSKQLGDLRVEWAANQESLKIKLEEMKKKDKELMRILHSNGNLSEGASLHPRMAIKGYLGTDYPAFGRSIDNIPRMAPSVNVKTRLPGSFRYYPDYAYVNRYRYRYLYRNINQGFLDYGY